MIVELFGSPGSGKSTLVASMESNDLILRSKFNYIYADNLHTPLSKKILIFYLFILHHPIVFIKLAKVTKDIKFINRLLIIVVFSRLYQGIFEKNSGSVDIFDQNLSQWVWSLLYRRSANKNNDYIVDFLKYVFNKVDRICIFVSIEVELLDLINRLKSRKNGHSPIESGNIESVERSVKCHTATLNIINDLCSMSDKLHLIEVSPHKKEAVINKTAEKILIFCENIFNK